MGAGLGEDLGFSIPGVEIWMQRRGLKILGLGQGSVEEVSGACSVAFYVFRYS